MSNSGVLVRCTDTWQDSGATHGALAEVARTHVPGCCAVREDFAPYLQAGFPWHRPHLPHTHITTGEQWWRELSPVIINALVSVTALPAERATQLVPTVRAAFVDPRHWRLFEDVKPCLQALARMGWRHVVLSNHVSELPVLVESLGLGPHIAATFTSATLGYEKPHPQSFQAVLSGYPGARAVMVGDNYVADVLGAQASGLFAILVRKPHAHATVFHESLATLPPALAGV